ncbi:hypothetical protein ACFL9T_23100, partial [Thermodesulfobacteriota bacterium]
IGFTVIPINVPTDSYEEPQNLYLYANGDPIGKKDPSGLITIDGQNCTEKSRKVIPSISTGSPFYSYKAAQRVICSDIVIEDTFSCVCIGYWENAYTDLFRNYLSYQITYTCCEQEGCEKSKCKDVKRVESFGPTIRSRERYKRIPEKGKVIMHGNTTAAFGGCSACPGGIGAPM